MTFQEWQEQRGKRPTTYQSWGRESVRATINELQHSKKGATEKQLVALLCDKASDDTDVLTSMAEWCVRAHLEAQEHHARHRKPVTLEEREKREEEITIIAKAAAEQILLLNWEMPNGKRLRYCSGDYVAKVCGPFAKAGKKAGRKLMGEVFSEQQLREYVK